MAEHQPEIRSIANRTELESVYDILGDAFPVGKDFFQNRLDHDSTYDRSTTWIAKQQEAITCTIQIFPFMSRVEDAEVKVGGIGSVATVPKYRGQGHCQLMLRHLTEWMEQQEYDLSLLFAVINPFYEKAGWSTVPEILYELNVGSILNSSRNSEYAILPFESSYSEIISNIYERFNDKRTYTVIRPSTHWQDRLHWPRWNSSTCLVAVRNGVTVAYGHISETGEDGAAYLEELCYLKGEEDAAIPLLCALVEQRPDAARVLAYLPDDHVLTEGFLSWGAVKKRTTDAMWKVIRFQPLLAKLAPVFQTRLQENSEYANKPLQIGLKCASQRAYLHYIDGGIAIESDPRHGIEYLSITLTERDFVSLLIQGYDASIPEVPHSDVLRALFPKQDSVFYNIDRF
ncbi:GNAT family N-acetyltransferase [Paenibacillus segetis]|uniref:N-acetyltransferase domain-containing protein n=1 Tax=Paenibacillus segetis TaxID=1325360 RepID=A0ABQ1Y1M2_9BACL|nr:GNAT family N-acetyltransferase [Paenibacillus segetis]GGH09746.1 hypothetical protein GCM10008013_00900 [Paenibacillus segetis]